MKAEDRAKILSAYLRPCPFCGRKVDTCEFEATSAGIHRLEVHCICGASVEIEKEILYTIQDSFLLYSAVDTWNTRDGNKEEPEADE